MADHNLHMLKQVEMIMLGSMFQRHFPALYLFERVYDIELFSHSCNKCLDVILLKALQVLKRPLQISYTILQMR